MCSIELQPVITTPRLRLRRPRRADAPRIAKLLNDFDLARMTASIPHPYEIEDAEAYLGQVDETPQDRLAMFVIEHPAEGPIGAVGFDSEGQRKTEIGYWIGRPYWGCGFATEATKAALVWASREWKRRHVMARHFSDNPASGEVLCKAGFLYTGDVELGRSRARGEDVPSRTMVWLA